MAHEKQALEKLVESYILSTNHERRARANDIDLNLRADIGKNLNEFFPIKYPDPSIFYQKSNNNYVIDDARLKNSAGTLKEESLTRLNDYVYGNLEDITAKIGRLDSSELYKIMLSVKPSKIGDAGHDKTAEIHGKFNYMLSLFGEDGKPDINEMNRYIIARNSFSETCLEIARDVIAGNPDGSLLLFQTYVKQSQDELKKRFLRKANGKEEYDIGKISAYLKSNISKLSKKNRRDVYGALGVTLSSLEKSAKK